MPSFPFHDDLGMAVLLAEETTERREPPQRAQLPQTLLMTPWRLSLRGNGAIACLLIVRTEKAAAPNPPIAS